LLSRLVVLIITTTRTRLGGVAVGPMMPSTAAMRRACHAPRRVVPCLLLLVCVASALGLGFATENVRSSERDTPNDPPSKFGKDDSSPGKHRGPSTGLTDDSPLATHKLKPPESLCAKAEEGHRRATSFGNELLKRGELLKAEACFLSALRHKHDFPMALYGLGEVHVGHELYGLAIEAYTLATQTWPQYVDAFVGLGDVLVLLQKNKKAEEAYKSAVGVGKTDALAWEALGRFYLSHQVKQFKQARVTYQRALLAVSSGDVSPGLLLGLAESARGAEQFEECVLKADKASSLAPNFARAKFVAGTCRVSAGDVVGAVPNFEYAVSVEPEQVEHHVQLAKALVTLGKRDVAEKVLTDGIKTFADSGNEIAKAELEKVMEEVVKKTQKEL
jgi:tetratricopeptide (TPR) repeat protein